VERRQNSRDKRVFNIFMTEEGKVRAQELVIDRPDFAAMFLSPLSGEEKRQLLELLMRLTESNEPEEPDLL
jgi:DNA-binding MarR family transcriptional regulator